MIGRLEYVKEYLPVSFTFLVINSLPKVPYLLDLVVSPSFGGLLSGFTLHHFSVPKWCSLVNNIQSSDGCVGYGGYG